MKIFIDNNNFIVEFVDQLTCVCGDHNECDLDHEEFGVIEVPNDTRTCIYTPDLVIPKSLFNEFCGNPRYKWINNTLHEITDPTEYQVDSDMWGKYIVYAMNHVQELIKTMTNDQLKDLYDNSADYMKEIIYNGIEIYWAVQIPQYRLNLAFETLVRVFAEMLYIKDIEKREMTENELAGYNLILQKFKNHNSIIYPPGQVSALDPNSWYQYYMEYILTTSDQLRANAIPQRYFVTGRV